MIKVERGLKVVLPQGEFLKVLSENNSSERFYLARKEGKFVDIGEIRGDTPHRIIVGSKSSMTEIFPQPIAENASNVVVVTMPQDYFYPQVPPSTLEGVLDIGHVGEENRATRTIIAKERQMQVIFPNIELPLI